MDDKTRNRVMLVLFLGVLMGALDIAIVSPALTPIQNYFGVDDRAKSWIFTIYVLFNLIGTPLMAKLSDIFGRRSIYILDISMFAVGSLVVSLSPHNLFSVLLVGRALQGFGAGGVFPVASAVIGDSFPPEKRGGALGLIGAVFGLAFLVGPILGGIIMTFTVWQWLFIVNLPIALVVIVLGLRLLPSSHPETRRAFDWPGMLVLGILLTALAYGLNQIDTQNFFRSLVSLSVWPFLLLAVVLIVIFPIIERRAADPVLRIQLFSSRQSVLASALAAGAGLGEVGMVFIPSLAIAAMPSIINKHSASYLLIRRRPGAGPRAAARPEPWPARRRRASTSTRRRPARAGSARKTAARRLRPWRRQPSRPRPSGPPRARAAAAVPRRSAFPA